jgi:2-desacetyl-2-hydroxyethyl bacteriochlorophyllide A dehydrogenase
MQTAVLEAPRRFGVVERPVPAVGKGQVLVRVAATAICHTDLTIYTGDHPGVHYPVVLGHEAAGMVDAVGAGVSRAVPGQRVLINPIIACGSCDSCLRGAENLCRTAGLLGRELDGSLCGYLCLPERFVYPLPAHLPLDDATLIETLATVRHGQARAAIQAGEAVAVLGQGAAGLLHTRLARLAGGDPVISISRSQWKLDMARGLGAHRLVKASAEDAVDEVNRITGGSGVDLVVDAAGGAAVFKAGLEMLRPGGRLLAFSVDGEAHPGFSMFPVYFKELSIIGSRALVPADLTAAIELAASGAVDLSGFITARFPLAETPAAFEEYERDPEHVLRIAIGCDGL